MSRLFDRRQVKNDVNPGMYFGIKHFFRVPDITKRTLIQNKVTILQKRSSFWAIFFFLLFTATYASAFDVSGDYNGFYQYYDAQRKNIVGHFTMSIKQEGQRITGIINEPRTNFGPDKPFLLSDMTGTINGTGDMFSVDFVKTYRYDGHTVHYRGTYKSYQGEIAGEWNIGDYKGNFKIANVNPRPDLDFEPPDILLVKPEFIMDDESGEKTRAIKIVSGKDHRIAGYAADNVKIDRIVVNGSNADIEVPSVREKHILSGNVVKFSAPVHVDHDKGTLIIEAVDINNNKKVMQLMLTKSGEAVKAVDEPSASGGIYRNKFAVIIGINRYNQWPPLECAVNDAMSMKQFLEKKGYQVISILDREATRNTILKTLGYDLPARCQKEDSVLIYFAGHGHTESLQNGGKEGYIVPVDAGTTDSFLSAISMRQLRSITQRIKSKHVLFLMDSCYSGLGFTRSSGLSSTENDYIKKISSYRAVQMITAGGMNEQVIEEKGHGLFTKNLLSGLSGKADLDHDGYVTASELGSYLRPLVTRESQNRQTPNFGRFEGEGEYVFHVESKE